MNVLARVYLKVIRRASEVTVMKFQSLGQGTWLTSM